MIFTSGVYRKMSAIVDMTGQKLGILLVMGATEKRFRKQVVWRCLCDCGNETEVPGFDLRSGNTKSCGCLHRAAGERSRIDITGQRFNKLTAIRPTNRRSYKNVIWLCVCDCGNETLVRQQDIVNGHTTSCGCTRNENAREMGLAAGRWPGRSTSGVPISGTSEYRQFNRRKYRALKKNAKIGKFGPGDIDKKFQEWGNACIYCGSKENITVDHLIPLSRGGDHSLSNMIPACFSCNASKNNRYVGSEWWPNSWPHNIQGV
jgi:hypothetical protein